MNWRLGAAFVVLLCLLPNLACSGSEMPTYLALGDSYAAGEGASSSGEAYVPLFFSFLEEDAGRAISLRNFAVGGETTTSMIAQGQLGKALAELRFRNQDSDPENDVFVITLDIGGNDLLRLVDEGGPCAAPDAISDPACTTAVSTAIAQATQNLTAILRALRVAAGPDVKILVLDYFNPYSGTGKSLEPAGDTALPLLNESIKQVASTEGIDAEVVATFDAFEGKGATLTNIEGPEGDFHPNDDGYRLMADLLIDAYKR